MPKKKTDPEPKPDLAADMFPLGNRYKLDSGKVIEVHKWTVGTLTRFTQRVPQVVEKFMDAPKDTTIVAMFPDLLDEITEVVSESVGISVEEIKETWTAEDLLGVTEVVWDRCLGSLLEKTWGLTMRMQGLVGQEPETSTPTPSPDKP